MGEYFWKCLTQSGALRINFPIRLKAEKALRTEEFTKTATKTSKKTLVSEIHILWKAQTQLILKLTRKLYHALSKSMEGRENMLP